MTYFTESYVPGILIAVFVGLMFFAAYVNCRKVQVLGAGILSVIVIAILAVSIEKFIETEREQVKELVYEVADTCEENNPQLVIDRFVDPDALTTKMLVEMKMGMFHVDSIRVKNIQVQINDLTSPPTAQIHATAIVTGQGKGSAASMIPKRSYPVEFEVEVHKIGDRWLATDQVSVEPRTL